MTRRMLTWPLLAAMFAAIPQPLPAQIDEPVRGKKYLLGPENGPWMIMVTSFCLPPGVKSASEVPEGMSPEEAANALVYELRTHGVPAYTYTLGRKTETIKTFDRLAEPEVRQYTSQQKGVCVLAGNYQTIDRDEEASRVAVQTLKWIKHFQPKMLQTEGPQGFVMYDYSGRERGSNSGPYYPLMGAFFSTNPLSDKLRNKAFNSERHRLMVSLNSGTDVSLYKNPGNYTLIVASFHGKSSLITGVGMRRDSFDESFSTTLDQAGKEAWQLAGYMRKLGREAYVWHDTTVSVVTVGSFESLDDPKIDELRKKYRAKVMKKRGGGRVLTAEYLTIPRKPTAGNPVQKRWIFDPKPKLMKVPVK